MANKREDSLGPPHVGFVILGHARCGSNLLMRTLGEHPEVRISGEVLRADVLTGQTDGWGWTALNPGAWAGHDRKPYVKGQDGYEYFEQTVFGAPWVEGIRASGCKLFYEQGRWDDAVSTAWDYVLESDVRVIHIIRHNLLDSLISKEIAERTNRWIHLVEHGPDGAPPLPPFRLEAEDCHRYFDRITGWRVWAGEMLEGPRTLTLAYDQDLCGIYAQTISRAQRFLGLTLRSSAPGTHKQQALPPSLQLENYAELARYFSRTPYAEYFAEA